jgi:hypothetical protein
MFAQLCDAIEQTSNVHALLSSHCVFVVQQPAIGGLLQVSVVVSQTSAVQMFPSLHWALVVQLVAGAIC